MRITDLDTPAIVIDLDIMERNLRSVADYARGHRLRLRPHTKTHKIPALGRRQIELGAAGLAVAKSTEAEVMLASGTPDLLVGSRVELQGMGAPFDGGPYHVTRVCHTYERRNGLRTHLEAERATVSEP